MKTKIFTLFVTLICAAQVFAYHFEVDEIYYNILGGDSVEVTSSGSYPSYSGSTVTIPETVEYNSTIYRVTAIDSYAFDRCSSLTDITIPNSVTTIGYRAFLNCKGLTSISIPNSVTTISDEAFLYCSVQYNTHDSAKYLGNSENSYHALIEANTTDITSCSIHKSTKVIADHAFNDCSALTSITIPNSVTTIGERAFLGCSSLTTAIIGDNVSSIGESAFEGCSNLTSITIPESITSIGYYVFFGCSSITEVIWKAKNSTVGSLGLSSQITSFIFGNEVENIPASLCKDMSSLATVTIPESVTTIGESAFSGCAGLTSIAIPNNVTLIGRYAFSDCGNITKFICQSATMNTDAGESFVLANTGLDTVIAPASFFDLDENYWSGLAKNIRYIEVNAGEVTADAFAVINRSYKTLTHLDLAATTNTEIADEAFKGCYKLETLFLPTQLERIGYMAVADCKNLQAIDIPATVTDIDDSAFENCRSIQTLTFGGQQPASAPAFEETHHRRVSTAAESALQRIGNWAFYNCHELQHLEIPQGVTEIGAAAFYGCTYLEDLTLPASVQSIGDNCFALCSKLNKITCLATTPPTIEAKTFYDVNRTIPLYVPEASINDYANDTYWGEFINPQAAESTTGVETLSHSVSGDVRKVLENGVLYILRNSEKYTIDGRKVE